MTNVPFINSITNELSKRKLKSDVVANAILDIAVGNDRLDEVLKINSSAREIDGVVDYKNKNLIGVIRQYPANSGWAFIENETHAKKGFDDTITVTSSEITLNYAGIEAEKVGTLVACFDETYQKYGLQVGASVEIDNAKLRFSIPLSCYITLGNNGVVAGDWLNGSIAVTKTNGEIVITHPAVTGNSSVPMFAVKNSGVPLFVDLVGFSTTTTTIKLYTADGTLVTSSNAYLFFTRGLCVLDPSKLYNETGNIWLYGQMH